MKYLLLYFLITYIKILLYRCVVYNVKIIMLQLLMIHASVIQSNALFWLLYLTDHFPPFVKEISFYRVRLTDYVVNTFASESHMYVSFRNFLFVQKLQTHTWKSETIIFTLCYHQIICYYIKKKLPFRISK